MLSNNVQSDTFTLKASDGIHLFINKFSLKDAQKTAPQKKRVLCVVHGFGEHGGRYQHLAEYLNEEFDVFYSIDLRGHGRSGGLRGHSSTIDQILSDLKLAFTDIQAKEPGAELALFAHSFGGMLGLSYLLKEKPFFKLAIISAPLLEVAMPISPMLKKAAKFLNKTLSTLLLSSDINPNFLSHDPKAAHAYMHDRLVHTKITPRMFFNMEEAMTALSAKQGPLPCPTLFLLAGEDRIVSTPKVEKFYANLKGENKTIIKYDGFYHELVNETEKRRVFGDMKEWIKQVRL